MSSSLDLRATPVKIKFDKGKTLNPVFFYLSPTFSVIDLTGYTARMQVKLTYQDVTPLFNLTTENGGLSIVTGIACLDDGTSIPNAQGIKVNITSTQTAAITFPEAIFDIELINPFTVVLPFVKGILIPYSEVTT